MSLTFGPEHLAIRPSSASKVKVTKWDESPANLTTPVAVDSQGRVSFTVDEPGRYRVEVREITDTYTRTVNLGEEGNYDPTDVRSIVDFLLSSTGGESAPATWASITGKPATFPPTIGTTATTAKAGNYQPAAVNISDSSPVGRSVLTAADAAAARTAIGAGTSSVALPATATAAELQAGTVTATRLVSPKLIHDEIARQIAAIPPA